MNEDLSLLESRAESLVEEHEALMRLLLELRTRHDLTQAQVAERMGVTQPTVAALERYDSNPTLATVRRYAMAVGARIEHLVIDDCVDHSEQAFEGIVRHVEAPRWMESISIGTVNWKTAANR